MPYNQWWYLKNKQNCQQNCQQSQQKPHPLLKQQHSISAKYPKRCSDARQHQLIVVLIALILLNTFTECNVSAAAAAYTLADDPVVVSTSNYLTSDIRGDNEEIAKNPHNVIGEIRNGNNLLFDTVNGSGNTVFSQHRNGFHRKFSKLDKEVVDHLIKRWAPIVWLAPEEKFMPLGVDEFLNHVQPMDKGKTLIPDMPIGDDSMKAYLVTKAEIDELLENEKSFIYGRNPNEAPVPIYAVVTLCNEPLQKSSSVMPAPPVPSIPSSPTQTNYSEQIEASEHVNLNFMPSGHRTSSYQNPTIVLGAKIPLSSTRGPYIPVSIDPFEVRNDTVRRSSRLYPVFQRVRRNLPPIVLNLPPKGLLIEPYDDLALNKNPTDESNAGEDMSTTNAPVKTDSSGQVNNFIANLADNVKFSMPTEELLEENNIDIGGNFEQLVTKKPISSNINGKGKLPNFHVTYWMFYPYSQGKTMCTLSLGPLGSIPFPAVYGFCLGSRKDIGSHIGDWEHMSLYFTGEAEPEAMYVSAHDAGAYYSYNRLTGSFEFKKQETRKGILQRPNFPKTVTTFNNHPVLFAAKGSHGLWTAPGKHRFVKVARLYDINGFGTPWNTWKAVHITYENLKSYGRALIPSWLSFKGKWGNPKTKCHPFRRIGLNFCEYTDGPTGIPLKEPHFQCGLS